MNIPDATPRSKGTVPVGYAYGPNLENRGVMWVPWNRSSFLHKKGEGHFHNPDGINALAEKVEIPEEVIEAKQATLPAIRRRGAREKAEGLATELFKDAMRSQQMYGRVVWPRSIVDVLVDLGMQDKDMYEQVDALVGHYMLVSENQRKESDSKLVARGWHGHFD